MLTAARQMHNRGNGGGGIAMAGLDPAEMRAWTVTPSDAHVAQIALLDPTARAEIEAAFIEPHFAIAQATRRARATCEVDGLEVPRRM